MASAKPRRDRWCDVVRETAFSLCSDPHAAACRVDDVDDARFTCHERDFHGALNTENHDYLDYMHARYYDPNKGRFLSVDPVLPISQAMHSLQRWNRYAYVSNNPLKNVDPDGREQVTFGDKRTEMLFKRLEARHPQVRATLGRYRGEGTPDKRRSRY